MDHCRLRIPVKSAAVSLQSGRAERSDAEQAVCCNAADSRSYSCINGCSFDVYAVVSIYAEQENISYICGGKLIQRIVQSHLKTFELPSLGNTKVYFHG